MFTFRLSPSIYFIRFIFPPFRKRLYVTFSQYNSNFFENRYRASSFSGVHYTPPSGGHGSTPFFSVLASQCWRFWLVSARYVLPTGGDVNQQLDCKRILPYSSDLVKGSRVEAYRGPLPFVTEDRREFRFP